MVELTESLRAELHRMMLSCDDATQVPRLWPDSDGRLRLGLDTLRGDDVVMLCVGDKPMLVAAQHVAAGLDGAILHFRGRGDDRWGAAGLDVLRPRNGLFRRGVAVSSTTPTGSL
jgi:hypothetical protein